MNTIELTREVAKKFVTTIFPVTEHIPFKESFAIIFPASSLVSDEQAAIMDSISKVNYTTIYDIRDDKAVIECRDNTGDIIISAEIVVGNKPKFNKSTGNDTLDGGLLLNLLDILRGVLYQLSIPTVEKQIDEVKERKSQSVARNIPTPSKKYIYRTRYRFNSIATPRKPITRHTTAWSVMGHVRRFRNEKGEIYKEIWVNPYVKGKGVPKDSEYKITRI